MTTRNGEGPPAQRTCAAADRTGHALLHTLYQGNLKNDTVFLNEWYAVDLVKNQDGAFVGVIAICIETGETVYFKAKATILATGGAGRIYQSTTNAHINTGDEDRLRGRSSGRSGSWGSSCCTSSTPNTISM